LTMNPLESPRFQNFDELRIHNLHGAKSSEETSFFVRNLFRLHRISQKVSFTLLIVAIFRKQMRDFGEIFGLGIGFFNPRGQTVTKEDFIKDI
jgi:hypothetical protein